MSSSSASASASASASGASSTAGSSSVSIPQTAANGGASITNPARTAGETYYKIADNNFVTFGWNFTSLYVQPESLTIVASADTGNTYPIAVLPGTATELVWSPYDVEQTYSIPWAVTSYTASMWDERGPTASATGGRMSVNSDITFALYRPQEYTPLSSWTCASCSSASETLRSPLFVMGVFTTLAVVLSGWGILRRAAH